MIKRVLLLSFAFLSLSLQAQFSFLVDQEEIETNHNFEFNTVEHEAKLDYIIRNDASSTIGLKAEILEINGSNGSDFEICFGECVPNVSVGTVIPQSNPVGVVAGGSTNPNNHMWNKNASSDLISYKIKFFQVDPRGNPTGQEIVVNYIYNKRLGVYQVEKSKQSVRLVNTIAKQSMTVEADEEATIELYSFEGKKIMNQSLSKGSHTLPVASLQKGVYLVKIHTQSGKVFSEKMIKN